ncbi:AMP-dependent synthetase/ligase [Arsenicicoccus sp. oral taxon 190]|uniref:AMP-dependent synthetase/ligase n=1 Tax=Arsenicicoccus sp. oral taxon 190 TaxID=1658671 RepID=UPI000679F7A5|nr:AMP-dependent synthetase/ligase [Arsenicicoccus sp. oral taxon 190]AKT52049.1 long-chain fatty acid--CoA ligase [Arsenicicoccus sp. oral taxon 190]
MDVTSTPIIVPAPTEGNLAGLVSRNAARHPDRVVFARRVDGQWRDVTSAQWRDEVFALAKGLVHAGVQPGDRVGILAATRYEWTLTDFALWTAGAVGVPIYETSSAEQVAWILQDAGCVGVVVERPEHADRVAGVRDRLPELRDVWVMDAGDLDELAAEGASVQDDTIRARAALAGPSDLATIIYTSGTTGRPKGVELTHSNFMALSDNTRHHLPEVVADASTLMFLPLAHVFARLIQVLVVDYGLRVGHSPSIKNLLDDLAGFRPTFLLVVPRVLEKIYVGAEQKAEAGRTNKVFHAAARTAIAYSRALDTGRVPLALRAQHALYDRLVYARLRAAMGGRVKYAVSGGAPLGPRLTHFFRGIGVTVLEGYGLTETTAPMAVNTVSGLKVGTVGRPMPGVEVAVAEDGELLTRGINVFRGYHGNPEATREAFVDGWFRTGDLGAIDDSGHVRITGRKKEIIVTAGGKNVAPAVLEDRLRANPIVSQCVVVGDHRPFIAALVTLDEEMWPGWAARHGLDGVAFADAAEHPRVQRELEAAVAHANEAVSRAESIRKVKVLDTDFTEANGYLTPSLKVKRHLVLTDFAKQVDAVYGGPVERE